LRRLQLPSWSAAEHDRQDLRQRLPDARLVGLQGDQAVGAEAGGQVEMKVCRGGVEGRPGVMVGLEAVVGKAERPKRLAEGDRGLQLPAVALRRRRRSRDQALPREPTLETLGRREAVAAGLDVGGVDEGPDELQATGRASWSSEFSLPPSGFISNTGDIG